MSNPASIHIRSLQTQDLQNLSSFYQKLPEDVVRRFQPHAFDLPALQNIYGSHYRYQGIIALQNEQIIGYAVVYLGHFDHDLDRMHHHGIQPNHQTDSQFAPAVDPAFHGQGIGQQLFAFAKDELQRKGIQRIFLWGGVQADNHQAIRYYEKLGFTQIGSFDYHGWNHDMVYQS